MKLIVRHPSGLEYKSKELNLTKTQLWYKIKHSDLFELEGEEYNYILMKEFLNQSVIVIL